MVAGSAARKGGRSVGNKADSTSVFSTEMLPERDRLPFFKEEFGRRMARLDVVPLPGSDFKVDIRALAFGDLRCVSLNTSPAAFGREGDLLKDGSDEFILLINSGPPLYDDRKARMVETGEATLQDSAQKGYVHLGAGGGGLSIAIPRHRLMRLVPEAEDVARAGDCHASREVELLRRYATSVLADGTASPDALRLAGDHILDLIALAIGAQGEAIELARMGGLKAARAHAIRKSIKEQIGDPNFSLASLAGRHHISERYVQLLFEEMGLSFTEYVQEQRLLEAHRALSNPMLNYRRIAEIAETAGFRDLSHFNRVYRRRFGETPSDTRASITDIGPPR